MTRHGSTTPGSSSAGKVYTVRLQDGSEIGPMDLENLRSWYMQRLINDSTLVKVGRGGRWEPLGGAVPFGRKPAPTTARTSASRSAPSPQRSRLDWSRLGRVALILGGVAALGAGGFWVYRQFLAGSARERQAAAYAQAEQRYEDATLGLTVEPPKGWLILRPDNPLLTGPPEARILVYSPRSDAAGYLSVESGSQGVFTLDEYLERVLVRQKSMLKSPKEVSRANLTVGKLPARKVLLSGAFEGKSTRRIVVAWKEGRNDLALVGWASEPDWQRASARFDQLLGAIGMSGVMAPRVAQAVSRALAEAPHLTASVAETLMLRSAALALEPEETFKRAHYAATLGLSQLPRRDVGELTGLLNAVYGRLPSASRYKLGSYLDRVRAKQITNPEEDRAMMVMMKGAVQGLSTQKRERLQKLYEAAVRSGVQRAS
jgi:hypothetical protein